MSVIMFLVCVCVCVYVNIFVLWWWHVSVAAVIYKYPFFKNSEQPYFLIDDNEDQRSCKTQIAVTVHDLMLI